MWINAASSRKGYMYPVFVKHIHWGLILQKNILVYVSGGQNSLTDARIITVIFNEMINIKFWESHHTSDEWAPNASYSAQYVSCEKYKMITYFIPEKLPVTFVQVDRYCFPE